MKHKRGKLREVRIRPMYDEKEKPSGYTVSADHEPAEKGKEGYAHYVPPIETPHETKEGAMAKANQHLNGGAGNDADGEYDDGEDAHMKPMRKAFGRPRRGASDDPDQG